MVTQDDRHHQYCDLVQLIRHERSGESYECGYGHTLLDITEGGCRSPRTIVRGRFSGVAVHSVKAILRRAGRLGYPTFDLPKTGAFQRSGCQTVTLSQGGNEDGDPGVPWITRVSPENTVTAMVRDDAVGTKNRALAA